MILSSEADNREPTYSQVRAMFEAEQVKAFSVEDGLLILDLHKPLEDGRDTVTKKLASFEVFYNDLHELIDEQVAAGIIEDYDYPKGYESPWWAMMIPYVLVGGLFLLIMFFLMNRAASGGGGGGSMAKFGKANVRTINPSDEKVTFRDVAGAEEEKAELAEIVDFLRNPAKYSAIGAKIPKGVLLVGPPGTGKTLIAKAVAGEAGVQFLSISGSDFVELYVGVGASRVRDLFEQAKKVAPSIVFIDEIDAVGRRRGAGIGGGHDEREQTLNQLLVEMDGFTANAGVIVIAATNRKDILDPALLRPGRFDRQIYVGTPDSKGREEILKVHARNKALSDDVDLSVVAKATSGFTGADLANLLNEAALHAARNNRPLIRMADLNEAMLKVIAGPEKRSRVVTEHEKRLTSVHEAGHAVVMYHLPTHDPVHQITIIPRGGAGGMTISLPEQDHSYLSRNEMFEQIVSLLGGRVAEQLLLDDISTGASNDIERATAIAREMVGRYGMSEKLGTVSYDSGSEIFVGRDYEKTKSYSERTAGSIDDEVKALIDRAYKQCQAILTEHLDQLKDIAGYLQENETMARNQFEAAMQGLPIPAHADSILASAEDEEAPVTIEAPDADVDLDEEDFDE
ncbi:MAG: ATP-dependent zinc metalloprotease FtsH [Ruminococcaceae bacterium]|nr:ATP-dependent zinc metalloprotease FtsH [Oscillospiraceae bacterium]